MGVNWSDLLNAVALVLIIEGLLPFISPPALKRTYESIQKMPDSTLRAVGLACVVIGTVLLLF